MTKSLVRHLYEELEKGNTKRALYIVELLGDNINKLYKWKSPLLWAKEFENEDVIRKLEEKGAREEEYPSGDEKLNIINMLIAKTKEGDLEGVTELLDKGVDVDSRDGMGWTALMRASEKGYLDVVEKLVEEGADINFFYKRRETALVYASYVRNKNIVKYLIDKGADVNIASGNNGTTALITACEQGYLDIVEMLIDAKADVNKADRYGKTPLMRALAYEQLEVIPKLIELGADPLMKDELGRTALEYAKDTNTRKLIIDAVKKRSTNDKSVINELNEVFFMENKTL